MMITKREAITILGFLTLFICVIFTGCSKDSDNKNKIVRPVKLIKPIIQDSLTTIETSGLIISGKEANLSFRIPGYIESIKVLEGQFVREGDILANLDKKDYMLQYQAVEAEYNKIIAEANRIINLYEKESVSKSDYDKAVSGKNQITAKYNGAKNKLSYTEIKAPFSGFIQEIIFDENEIIDAGMPVISIINNNDFEIETNISAELFTKRDLFVEYYCIPENSEGTLIPLTLKSILKKGNLNQLYKMTFRVEQNELKLASGMTADVIIKYKEFNNKLLLLPYRTVLRDANNSYVWVYTSDNQQITKTKITTLEVDANGNVQVESGITKDDMIVEAGVNNLKEGDLVKPLKKSSKSNFGGLL